MGDGWPNETAGDERTREGKVGGMWDVQVPSGGRAWVSGEGTCDNGRRSRCEMVQWGQEGRGPTRRWRWRRKVLHKDAVIGERGGVCRAGEGWRRWHEGRNGG